MLFSEAKGSPGETDHEERHGEDCEEDGSGLEEATGDEAEHGWGRDGRVG
jgi:hypothetical protein